MASTKILMYSFKGGSGRTVSSSNVALILARELGKRVVYIDIDIESAGSSMLFGLDEDVRKNQCWAIQDILRGASADNESIVLHGADFEAAYWPRMHKVVWPQDAVKAGSYLKVVPSHVILRTDQELSINTAEGKKRFGKLIMNVDGLQDSPDIVMYDSASGQQATAMYGLQTSHVLVIFVRWSRQFIIGTTQFLKEYIYQADPCRRLKKVFIVPTAVPERRPPGRLAEDLVKREEVFRAEIKLANGKAAHDFGVVPGWVEVLEPIRECEALKWDERLFLLDDGALLGDPGVSGLMQDYRRLASRLAGALQLPPVKKTVAETRP